MTTYRLDWQELLPHFTLSQTTPFVAESYLPITHIDMQPRLAQAIQQFCQCKNHYPFMLVNTNAPEQHEYLTLLAKLVNYYLPQEKKITGMNYQIEGVTATCQPATKLTDNFAARGDCHFQSWVEYPELMGYLSTENEKYSLIPGLVHHANGGILILPVSTLLTQPLMWYRFKQMILSQTFKWYSLDQSKSLPVQIPDMPLDLRVILISDHTGLAELHAREEELTKRALYAEFEQELLIEEQNDIVRWCRYTQYLLQEADLPPLEDSCWPMLCKQAVRYTNDQSLLPLSPLWISDSLSNTLIFNQRAITAEMLKHATEMKQWRENYLFEKIQYEINTDQFHIATEGMAIGQINGLSVLEYPGHPHVFGEPTRITCVAHPGDGEITDVERKSELGGNLHAKGMMILEAFLISELELEQPFPFSASIVFEQSYSEVDGDSASLAELCVLISALSLQPIAQYIAVTGSVDQRGRVQPIGGINEKIEGFFAICQKRGLSGQQGVILPVHNKRHLCLNDSVIEAVKNGLFHLWSVESVADALPLLTGLPYYDANDTCLLGIIKERISQAGLQQKRRNFWQLKWLLPFIQR